ncbi:MAG: acyl carrier protein [Chloroflexota bacterium]
MTQEDVFDVVKKNIRDVLYELEGQDIPLEASLKDLGANSIDRADIAVQCVEDLQIKIPMVEFANVKNIEDLVKLLTRKVNE